MSAPVHFHSPGLAEGKKALLAAAVEEALLLTTDRTRLLARIVSMQVAAGWLEEARATAELIGDALTLPARLSFVARGAEKLGRRREAVEFSLAAAASARSLGRPDACAVFLGEIARDLARMDQRHLAKTLLQEAHACVGLQFDSFAGHYRDFLMGASEADHIGREDILRAFAGALAHLERYAEALAIAESLPAAVPHEDAFIEISMAYAISGRNDMALNVLRQAFGTGDGSESGVERLYDQLIALGQWTAARSMIALTLVEEHHWSLLHYLAKTQALAGARSEAASTFVDCVRAVGVTKEPSERASRLVMAAQWLARLGGTEPLGSVLSVVVDAIKSLPRDADRVFELTRLASTFVEYARPESNAILDHVVQCCDGRGAANITASDTWHLAKILARAGRRADANVLARRSLATVGAPREAGMAKIVAGALTLLGRHVEAMSQTSNVNSSLDRLDALLEMVVVQHGDENFDAVERLLSEAAELLLVMPVGAERERACYALMEVQGLIGLFQEAVVTARLIEDPRLRVQNLLALCEPA